MLIGRHQCAEMPGIEAVHQNHRVRAVAVEPACSQPLLQGPAGQALAGEFVDQGVGVAPAHERLGLGETVGHALALAIVDGGLGVRQRQHEIHIGGEHALMEHLEEGVLGVGTNAAPDRGHGLHPHRLAVAGHGLAVGFHFQLLQEGRHRGQALRIGHHDVARQPEKVVVPHADERQRRRQVGLQRRGLEMVVHGMGAGQQRVERLHAQAEGDRNADRRP